MMKLKKNQLKKDIKLPESTKQIHDTSHKIRIIS
jgi:hypothetical protein